MKLSVEGLALERLTRNQKPIPHLSVFMVIKVGHKYNFTLLSILEIISRNIMTIRRGRGKKGIERSKEN